jgi:hypothetical protein
VRYVCPGLDYCYVLHVDCVYIEVYVCVCLIIVHLLVLVLLAFECVCVICCTCLNVCVVCVFLFPHMYSVTYSPPFPFSLTPTTCVSAHRLCDVATYECVGDTMC